MPDFLIENELIQKGHKYIAGIDEAGRGPLAGPVVAAAVILPTHYSSKVLNDSKKISPKVRGQLYDELTDSKSGVIWSFSVVSAEVIDEINDFESNDEYRFRNSKDKWKYDESIINNEWAKKTTNDLLSLVIAGQELEIAKETLRKRSLTRSLIL